MAGKIDKSETDLVRIFDGAKVKAKRGGGTSDAMEALREIARREGCSLRDAAAIAFVAWRSRLESLERAKLGDNGSRRLAQLAASTELAKEKIARKEAEAAAIRERLGAK